MRQAHRLLHKERRAAHAALQNVLFVSGNAARTQLCHGPVVTAPRVSSQAVLRFSKPSCAACEVVTATITTTAAAPSIALSVSYRLASSVAAVEECVAEPYASPLAQKEEEKAEEDDAAAFTDAVPYDVEAHVAEAERALRDVFGPQAKLVVHKLQQRRRRQSNGVQPSPATVEPTTGNEEEEDALAGRGEAEEHGRSASNENEAAGKGREALSGASHENEQPTTGPLATSAGHTESPATSPSSPAVSEQTEGSATPGYYYRASATFRFLGFPVELAATKGRDPATTIDNCVHQALSSDVEFIRPSSSSSAVSGAGPSDQRRRGTGGSSSPSSQRRSETRTHSRRQRGSHSGSHTTPPLTPHQQELKAIVDELRSLCVHFSRTLKFSIKPPLSAVAPVHVLQRRSGGGDGVSNGAPEPDSSSSGSSNPNAATGASSVSASSTARETGAAARSSTAQHGESAGVPGAQLWRCRAYLKDDWSVVAHVTLAQEERGRSPKAALSRCMATLRNRFKAELESPEVMLESVRELAALVEPAGKLIQARCTPEEASDPRVREDRDGDGNGDGFGDSLSGSADNAPSPTPWSQKEYAALQQRVLQQQPQTFGCSIVVEDGCGNRTVTRTRRQPTALMAYQTTSAQAIHTDFFFHPSAHLLSQSLPTSPLLQRLRWQFQCMVQTISAVIDKPPHVVGEIRVSALGGGGGGGGAAGANGNGPAVVEPCDVYAPSVSTVALLYTASFVSEGTVVWQATSGGRYRVELDAYVQALEYLLDQYADLVPSMPLDCEGGGILFPTVALLEYAVARHDGFSVVAHHRGRWNCYALLGTLTSQLIGAYYQTHYEYNAVTGEWCATLTTNDGDCSAQVLVQRTSKRKGEAWRLACLAALRENFPRQYAEALRHHPDVDLSVDTMARGSRFRALPREKRVQHIGNLFSLIAAFAEEDLGWSQLRIRLRNASGDLGLPQWIAEMEALVEGETERRAVAVSPPYTQVKHARRVLLYRVAQQYFPKELAIYQTLPRGDATDPETDPSVKLSQHYIAGGPPFTVQLLTLLQRAHSAMAPLSWTLRRCHHYTDAETKESGEPTAYRPAGTASATTADSLSTGEKRGDEDDEEDDGWREVVDGDVSATDTVADRFLRSFSPRFTAQVLAQRGDLLVAEHTGTHEESAVEVLLTALRTASAHLGGAEVETLWTEFETQSMPPLQSAKELALFLFQVFFGVPGQADDSHALSPSATTSPSSSAALSTPAVDRSASASTTQLTSLLETGDLRKTEPADGRTTVALEDAVGQVLSVESTQLGDFWCTVAALPRIGGLVIARAFSSTKKGSVNDAIVLAARKSFPRMLQFIAKHDTGACAVATDILTEPIIEQLPDATVRDLRRLLDAQRRGPRLRPPFQLLAHCVRRDYQRERHLRVQQTQETGSVQCRIYLQHSPRLVAKGKVQLVGYGAALTAAQALHMASIMALQNLFEGDLVAAEAQCPTYRLGSEKV